VKVPQDPIVPLGATYQPRADRLHVGEPVAPEVDSGPEFPLTAAARDYAVIADEQLGVAVIDRPEAPADGADVPPPADVRDPMDPGEDLV
jgi:hypothetical protein